MEKLRIESVFPSALREVADFIRLQRVEGSKHDAGRHSLGEDSALIEKRLRWLLIENPFSNEGDSFGYCARDHLGTIRGLNLAFPASFFWRDKRLYALGSGSFFVESSARSVGFYLFKSYLRAPNAAFYFATTCNANSGALWKALGGRPVLYSDFDYALPLNLGAIIPAWVEHRSRSKAASALSRVLGSLANPVLELLTKPPKGMLVESSRDWEKLARLSSRHRPSNAITVERSARLLEWRFGEGSPAAPCRIHIVRDRQGNEAWVCLRNVNSNGSNHRRTVLLDAVWPRDKLDLGQILAATVETVRGESDVLLLRGPAGIDFRKYCRWVTRSRLSAPRAFAFSRLRELNGGLGSIEYDDSDYIAWGFSAGDAHHFADRESH